MLIYLFIYCSISSFLLSVSSCMPEPVSLTVSLMCFQCPVDFTTTLNVVTDYNDA